MLSKKNRADKKDIDLLFERGKSITSPSFNFKFILRNNVIVPHISFIVPKSIAKLAVKRNLLRRCGYEAFKKHTYQFSSSLLGVFIFKKYQDDVPTLENEIKNIFNKIN